jgi:hypothetical protein
VPCVVVAVGVAAGVRGLWVEHRQSAAWCRPGRSCSCVGAGDGLVGGWWAGTLLGPELPRPGTPPVLVSAIVAGVVRVGVGVVAVAALSAGSLVGVGGWVVVGWLSGAEWTRASSHPDRIRPAG